jgi:hypothetical protein
MRLVIRPIEPLQAESAEAQARGVHGKRRCAIAPFANGGGYTRVLPVVPDAFLGVNLIHPFLT